jgi:hypothetical protein
MTMPTDLQTPFEQGNGNQTTTWEACIAFYFALAERFPNVLRFLQIGVSDAGVPLHAGIVSADGVFERERIKSEARPVFFNNNGIHPGEPEGVDACMALGARLLRGAGAPGGIGTHGVPVCAAV